MLDPERGGLDPVATAQLAVEELGEGDPVALERLAWLLSAASPTWAWPERIHPRLGTGCVGDGHSPAATAAVLDLARSLLVREEPGGLVLLSLLPETWRGQGLEVHDAPTEHGVVSYAVRWHGERPALLWELEGVGAVRLTAPGLDPAWSTEERRGDALLGRSAAPYLLPEAGSFS